LLVNKKYLTSANAEQKKVLDLGQCGDFTVLAKQELRGINRAAVYARKVKYYVDIKTGSYKFGWKELKYLGLVGFWGVGRRLSIFIGRVSNC